MNKETIFQSVQDYLVDSEFSAKFKKDCFEEWMDVWTNLDLQFVSYSSSMLNYQHAYHKNSEKHLMLDISLVMFNDSYPCGIWPLTLHTGDSMLISSFGDSIYSPVFIKGLSKKAIKKLTTSALRFLVALQKNFAGNCLSFHEFCPPGSFQNGISEWHQLLMSHGGEVSIKHDLYVDLSLTMDEIRHHFRKSYKPLISSALKLLQFKVMDRSNADNLVWNEFKNLHKNVAGRITRSNETWELQYEMIQEGNAMLIHLHDSHKNNRMVGAGFFQTTSDEGLYSVAAYDRELFNMPIGHLVQQIAIEKMKADGLRIYRIGERLYPADKPSPSNKELNISLFKQGFATHQMPRLNFFLSDIKNQSAA